MICGDLYNFINSLMARSNNYTLPIPLALKLQPIRTTAIYLTNIQQLFMLKPHNRTFPRTNNPNNWYQQQHKPSKGSHSHKSTSITPTIPTNNDNKNNNLHSILSLNTIFYSISTLIGPPFKDVLNSAFGNNHLLINFNHVYIIKQLVTFTITQSNIHYYIIFC